MTCTGVSFTGLGFFDWKFTIDQFQDEAENYPVGKVPGSFILKYRRVKTQDQIHEMNVKKQHKHKKANMNIKKLHQQKKKHEHKKTTSI